MSERAAQIAHFIDRCGWSGAPQQRVAGDASNRKYDRLSKPDGDSAILMDAPPETGENVRPFVSLSIHLRDIGLSAPEIYHQDADLGLLLIEDFGDALFADLMANDPSQELPLYRSAADVLIKLQDAPLPDVAVCDASWLTEMVAPVFEWYVPDPKAQAAFSVLFQPLANRAVQGEQVLILRDYHAQNLLHLPARSGFASVGVLDFQDAMLGHPAYDLVSILQDARRDVSIEVEEEIKRYMLSAMKTDTAAFSAIYAILGLQRNLRIIGIFARLCLRDGKAHYVDMIPRVWGYVQRNLDHPDLSEIAAYLNATLPVPTPSYLEHLKARCATHPSP